MSRLMKVAVMTALAIAMPSSLASAAEQRQIVVPKGTRVILTFDQALSSQTASVGDRVKLHVKDDVAVGGELILKKDTKVTAILSRVRKKGTFGRSGKLNFALNPVETLQGVEIALEPGSQGQVAGEQAGHAAAASAAGGIVLGPLGLAAGIFIQGKETAVKSGDLLYTQTAKEYTIILVAPDTPAPRPDLADEPLQSDEPSPSP